MVKTGAISCVSCRQAFNDTEIQQDFIYCVLFERFLESAKKILSDGVLLFWRVRQKLASRNSPHSLEYFPK